MKAKPKRKSTPRRKVSARPKQAARRTKRKVTAKAPRAAKPSGTRWVSFVKKHGVVFASARGTLPSVAEAVAGEPIVGSWWAHAKGRAIFQALADIDDSDDVRCFKLVEGKITLAHRRVWPALVRLAKDGVLGADRVASLQQEHMPTGEHRNFVTPYPEWVDEATAHHAETLSADEARSELGAWIDGDKPRKR
ncbi:MAG: hypothetical protein JWO36_4317 [Myxococcales bacterium]|nr:hypothetical protein [Myxococcales bacterium]